MIAAGFGFFTPWREGDLQIAAKANHGSMPGWTGNPFPGRDDTEGPGGEIALQAAEFTMAGRRSVERGKFSSLRFQYHGPQ